MIYYLRPGKSFTPPPLPTEHGTKRKGSKVASRVSACLHLDKMLTSPHVPLVCMVGVPQVEAAGVLLLEGHADPDLR
jgi:hypothetical protein